MGAPPVIATVIPTWQEEKHIERCLRSLISQTHPAHAHRILVVDGGSTDGTCDIVERVAIESANSGGPTIELFDNPSRYVPHARNLAQSCLDSDVEFVFEMIGHAWVPTDHLEIRLNRFQSIESNLNRRIGGLGARVIESDQPRTMIEDWVEASLVCPLGGSGQFARFSKESKTKIPPFTLYRREAIDAIGGWNEDFITTQDSELNMRLIQADWPLWRTAETHVRMAKRNTLNQWWNMGYRYGFWRMKHVMDAKSRMRIGEFLPWIGLAIVLALIIDGQSIGPIPIFSIPILLYVGTLFCVGIDEARRWKNPTLIYGLPCLLVLLHTSFSMGLLFGTFRSGNPPNDRVS
ncbi:MAG: glycosyltransferase [Candidatus Thalassarchaeaceae archaeon]|jgi:glycosyltransferase involved in cell wall biosynthesis|nr:glycosyltransferase [Candidatus Thalassarchaeaceae archaeon]